MVVQVLLNIRSIWFYIRVLIPKVSNWLDPAVYSRYRVYVSLCMLYVSNRYVSTKVYRIKFKASISLSV